MEERMFQPGDKVVWKTWSEMVLEYGLMNPSIININYGFTDAMERRVDREEVLTIASIDPSSGKKVKFEEEDFSLNAFTISTDMIKLAAEIGETELYCSEKIKKIQSIVEKNRELMDKMVGQLVHAVPDLECFACYFLKWFTFKGNDLAFFLNYGRDVSEEFNNRNVLKNASFIVGMRDKKDFEKSVEKLKVREDILLNEIWNGCYIIRCLENKEENDNFLIILDSREKLIADEFVYRVLEEFLPEEKYRFFANDNWEEIEKYFVEIIQEKKERDRLKFLKNKKDDFKENVKVISVKNYKEKIQKLKSDIESFQRNIVRAYTNLRAAQKNLLYAEQNFPDEKIEELFDMFIKYPESWTLSSMDNAVGALLVKTELFFFADEDVELVEREILNNCSVVKYRPIISDVLHRKVILMMEQAVVIEFENRKVWAADLAEYVTGTEIMGMENPHLKYHNCWGENEMYIEEYLFNKDYSLVLEQIRSAVAGINITESPTTNPWARDFPKWKNTRCLKDPDTGKLYNFDEYLKFAEERDSHEKN